MQCDNQIHTDMLVVVAVAILILLLSFSLYLFSSAVLKKNPATTVVVIDEVNTDNWGVGGKVVTDLRKRKE